MWGRVSGSERILFTVGSTLMISDLLDRILGIYPYCIYLATSTSRHLDASEAPGEDNDWCHYLLQQPPSLHAMPWAKTDLWAHWNPRGHSCPWPPSCNTTPSCGPSQFQTPRWPGSGWGWRPCWCGDAPGWSAPAGYWTHSPSARLYIVKYLWAFQSITVSSTVHSHFSTMHS